MRKRMILLVLIFLNLGTIFFFSHQNATTSTAISNALAKHIEVNTPDYEQKNQGEKNVLHNHMQRGLRKLAHACLFCSLGVLVLLFCCTFPMRWFWSVVCTIIFGFMCAIGDEFHQSFIPGRTAQWSDISYDMQGIILGVAVTALVAWLAFVTKKYTKKKRAD